MGKSGIILSSSFYLLTNIEPTIWKDVVVEIVKKRLIYSRHKSNVVCSDHFQFYVVWDISGIYKVIKLSFGRLYWKTGIICWKPKIYPIDFDGRLRRLGSNLTFCVSIKMPQLWHRIIPNSTSSSSELPNTYLYLQSKENKREKTSLYHPKRYKFYSDFSTKESNYSC